MRSPVGKTAPDVLGVLTGRLPRRRGWVSLQSVGMRLLGPPRTRIDPRLDQRAPKLYGLLLSLLVFGVGAIAMGLLLLIRLATA
jgi:hypothetical protein